ncbi:MAG: 4Fe-4S binding protein [Clostridia bacterium]|nr:4Fe-4S binding protein [Clostridia bacterium]
MDVRTRYHSVRLDKELCKGCTNCLMHCPTEAIRVRKGRAHILDERCIDCGECIRICDYHAKVAITDSLKELKRFRYTIALPAPSLYGQFRGLTDVGVVLAALKRLGFDDVFEVARGADVVSRAITEKLREPSLPRPLISSACPTVVRLIQVRFPDLIPHIVDVRQPMEVAAQMARDEFCRAHGCQPEEVGIFFITPCPAKMTAITSPLGQEKSAVDGAISMMEIYGQLRPLINKIQNEDRLGGTSTSYGIGWATSSGETRSIFQENALCVDGIQNCIRVLEEIENNKLSDLTFFEGNACTGGCVGGPLTFENNYVAKNSIRKLVAVAKARNDSTPQQSVTAAELNKYPLRLNVPLVPNGAMKLDENITVAMQKLQRMNEIIAELPGYDCGSCGSPTCRSFAEDIVLGFANEMECIHKMRDKLQTMAEQMVELAQTRR